MAIPDRVRAMGLSPEDEARVFVWEDMVQGVADRFRIDHASACTAAFTIPSNLLSMLDSPQGVAALGAFVVGQLGAGEVPPLLPIVH
jgi:hypothetical protein